MKMAREGSHLERPDVDYHRGKTVSVSGEAFYCSADGEIYGPERQRTWHLEPAAYSVILPHRRLRRSRRDRLETPQPAQG